MQDSAQRRMNGPVAVGEDCELSSPQRLDDGAWRMKAKVQVDRRAE